MDTDLHREQVYCFTLVMGNTEHRKGTPSRQDIVVAITCGNIKALKEKIRDGCKSRYCQMIRGQIFALGSKSLWQ